MNILPKPTDAAMRAAHAIWPRRNTSVCVIARFIDAETHLPQLQEALNVVQYKRGGAFVNM